MRDSAGKDFGETISQDDAGHGDGDCQVRFARLRRHVRPAPHARLCQMHRVRDASQVRQVCQVAKWARPHSLALMRANAKIHPRHIFRVSLASLVPSLPIFNILLVSLVEKRESLYYIISLF